MSELLFGFHPVREALRRRPEAVVELLIAASRRGARAVEIEALASERGVALRRLPEAELHRLSGGVDNGFLARVRAAPTSSGGADPHLLVLVEDIQDPRNLGALMRVCDGAGVGELLIRDRGSAPLSAAAAKSAAGAGEWLAVRRITNSVQEIERAKEQGFWAYALAMDGRAPWEVDLTGKLLLCLGGEEKGLRDLTRRRCDGAIGLPMRGRIASLNLATAAAAVLYEAVRQRGAGGLAREKPKR